MGLEDLKAIQEKQMKSDFPKKVKVKPVISRKKEADDGLPKTRHRTKKGDQFSDKYIRFTNYLSVDLYKRIDKLRVAGRLGSIKDLINNAVEKYLDSHY